MNLEYFVVLMIDGKPPQDHLIIEVNIKSIALEFLIPFCVISCLGILFSLSVMLYVAMKRNDRCNFCYYKVEMVYYFEFIVFNFFQRLEKLKCLAPN